MTTKIRVTDLDFDTIKGDLKNYLKSKPEFSDYNFDGSNLNILLDILAYNTHYQALMANFLGNEMFIDTAAKRGSVVSHAKYLGYTPQSTSSAKAVIDLSISIPVANPATTVSIPRGTRFTATVEGSTFMFSTLQTYIRSSVDSTNGITKTFNFSNVEIFEGTLVKNTIPYRKITNRVEIPNKGVDLGTLSVSVQLLDSSTFNSYSKASSFLAVDDTSKVYFIQEGFSENYEVYFGDGVIGRQPDDGVDVVLEYIVSSGSSANGARIFTPASSFGSGATSVVTTKQHALGGKNRESIDSIRFNAINYFGAQNRAVTAEDYKLMASLASQNIRSIITWGGEDHIPPNYGAVYVCVIPTAGESLTTDEKTVIKDFIKKKAVGNTRINFTDPEYVDLSFVTNITFDSNKLDISPYELETQVRATIGNYSRENLSKFSGKFRLSNLSKEIDNTHDSILSNTSTVSLVKYLTPNLFETSDITINVFNQINQSDVLPTVVSDTFIRTGDNTSVSLEDDRNGNMRLVTFVNGSKRVLDPKAGEVDYKKGTIYINPISISSYTGDSFSVRIKPLYSDISSNRNVVIRMNDKNILITSRADE